MIFLQATIITHNFSIYATKLENIKKNNYANMILMKVRNKVNVKKFITFESATILLNYTLNATDTGSCLLLSTHPLFYVFSPGNNEVRAATSELSEKIAIVKCLIHIRTPSKFLKPLFNY